MYKAIIYRQNGDKFSISGYRQSLIEVVSTLIFNAPTVYKNAELFLKDKNKQTLVGLFHSDGLYKEVK